MAPLRIDIWSDVACPWCYTGKRRFERALARRPEATSVHVTWHAFELNPAAPREDNSQGPYAERLAKKYRTTVSEARTMIGRVVDAAKAEGLDFDFEAIQPGNTFDAHRLLQHAKVHAKQDALKERLLHAYFCEGQAIGARVTLERLALEVGLDAQSTQGVLNGDEFSVEVRRDEALAQELGIHGVPFFVIEERYGVSGAQPPEVLLEVIEKACAERAAGAPALAEGDHGGLRAQSPRRPCTA